MPTSLPNSLLIKGGRIIDPYQRVDAFGDILILDGMVAGHKVSNGMVAPEGTPTMDATGLVVTPGFVDLHCHLREPGFEKKETIATGAVAAARGGFTTLCCMPNTDPAIDTQAAVEFVLKKARDEAVVRVLPVAAVTTGRKGRTLVDMEVLVRAGAIGFSDDGDPVSTGELMRGALDQARLLGIPIMDHCEDPALAAGGVMHEGLIADRLGLIGVPAKAEENLVKRDILLAEATGGHVHICHISTAGSVGLVKDAKKKGLSVTAEVTPHHLTLTHELVAAQTNSGDPYNTNTKVNPPLRRAVDVEALVAALVSGVVDAVATDHAPHATEDKECSYENAAFGISGFETALASVLSLVNGGRIALVDLVERMTLAPARIIDHKGLGLGTLKAGAVGDVAIFDPVEEWLVDTQTFASMGKNSPIDGTKLKGRIVATVFGGTVVFDRRGIVNNGR